MYFYVLIYLYGSSQLGGFPTQAFPINICALSQAIEIWLVGPRCIPTAYFRHKSEYALLRELNKFSFTSAVNGILGSGVKCPSSAATRRYFLKPSSSAYAHALPGSLRSRRDGPTACYVGYGKYIILLY